MESNTKLFLEDLRYKHEASQRGTMELIKHYAVKGNDPLILKISGRKEVISDMINSLKYAGLLTEHEAKEQAKLFDVEIRAEI